MARLAQRPQAAPPAQETRGDTLWLSPEGVEHRVACGGLAAFCTRHGLARAQMFRVRADVSSHHRGWRLSTQA